MLVERQLQIAQCLLHFALRGLGAQGLGQLGGELLWRGGHQFTPLRPAHVFHRTGLGGALLGAGLAEDREQ